MAVFLTSALVAWSVATPTSAAQKAQAKGGNKPPEVAAQKAAIQKMLREGQVSDEELFNNFFNNYFLQQFETPWRPYSLDDLPKLRRDLKVHYLVWGKSGAAHDELNKLVLKKMKAIIAAKKDAFGEFDTAIRYNAVLMIGDLNTVESPVKPWSEAYPVLMVVYQDKRFPDALKVAALVGLARLATDNGIPPSKAADLSKAMLELVNQKTAPTSRDPEAHDWMRRLAAQTLAALPGSGSNAAVVKAFQGIVADPKSRPSLRIETANFLCQLKYPPAAKQDFTGVANSVGHMIVDIGEQEIEKSKSTNRYPSRRVVMAAVDSSLSAFGRDGIGDRPGTGLIAAAKGSPHQKFIEQTQGKLLAMFRWLENPELDDATFESELPTKLSDFKATLTPVAATAKEQQQLTAKQEKR